jgi:hypothetical protein
MSSFETLILQRVLILSGSLLVQGKEENSGEFQKGSFMSISSLPRLCCLAGY